MARRTTPEDLFARLSALGIAHKTHTHAPVFTVEEAQRLRGSLAGTHCKCLFLKDKKARLFLVVARESLRIDLKWLSRALGADRLSFGSPELLLEVLGVVPGAVTPFALINDTEQQVAPVLDAGMMVGLVNYHPLVNTMTTTIASADLVRFIEATGHTPKQLDFPQEPRDALADQGY